MRNLTLSQLNFYSIIFSLFVHWSFQSTLQQNLKTTPWKQILTSKAVWALIIASIGQDWGCYTIITDFPKYMNDVLKYSPVEVREPSHIENCFFDLNLIGWFCSQNGTLSSITYTSIFVVSWISSRLCDWLLHRKITSAAVVRKSYATISKILFFIPRNLSKPLINRLKIYFQAP